MAEVVAVVVLQVPLVCYTLESSEKFIQLWISVFNFHHEHAFANGKFGNCVNFLNGVRQFMFCGRRCHRHHHQLHFKTPTCRRRMRKMEKTKAHTGIRNLIGI